jgi:hypothetical protein
MTLGNAEAINADRFVLGDACPHTLFPKSVDVDHQQSDFTPSL